ncbi:dienelactone hydrolase [Xylariaceae sp. FL1019]|nr:dienelactone hydrolase [Xylariaceae sp. FL1019]
MKARPPAPTSRSDLKPHTWPLPTRQRRTKAPPSYAANGYLTVIPDIFNGDPVPLNRPENFDFPKWMAGGSTGDNPHGPEQIDEIVVRAIEWLKKEHGITKIASSGYCLGAKYVARHFKDGISVGYFAHPSYVTEDELKGFQGPLSIAAAETDQIFTKPLRDLSEVVLKESGNPYQINLYSGTEHGFSVRADLSKKHARFAKEQAFIQAVTWFDTWLLE